MLSSYADVRFRGQRDIALLRIGKGLFVSTRPRVKTHKVVRTRRLLLTRFQTSATSNGSSEKGQ